jgi:hypothetical protein
MCVMSTIGLEPLAEVQGALLVVEVLHLPHPQLLGLLHVGEHPAAEHTAPVSTQKPQPPKGLSLALASTVNAAPCGARAKAKGALPVQSCACSVAAPAACCLPAAG